MRLQEFRKKYPQYNDVPDKQLADSLYEKFYASAITKDDFYSQIGLTPVEPFAQPEPITGMESAFATAPVLDRPRKVTPEPVRVEPTPYKSKVEAVDDIVNLAEEGVPLERLRSQTSRLGLDWDEVTARGQARQSPMFQTGAMEPISPEQQSALSGRMEEITPTAAQEVANVGRRGLAQLERERILRRFQTGQISETEAAERLRLNQRKTEAARAFGDVQAGIDRLNELNEAGDTLGVAKAIVNPSNFKAVLALVAESVIPSLANIPEVIAGGVLGGPGGAASASFATSFASEYANALSETLEKAGISASDPFAVSRALQDPQLLEDARVRGMNRGIPVATFNALTAGVGGRFVNAYLRALQTAGTQATKKGIGVAAAKEAGTQIGGGMAGEAVAQKATDEYKPLDILLEGIAELPGGVAEIATNVGRAQPKELGRLIPKEAPDVTIPPSQRPSPTISGEGIPISGRPERTLAPEGVAGAEPPPVGVPSVPAVEPVQGAGAPPPALDARKEIDTLLDEYATIDPVAAEEFRTLSIDPNATYTQDDVDILRETIDKARTLKEEETPQGAVEKPLTKTNEFITDKNGEPLVLYRGIQGDKKGAINAEPREGYNVFVSDSPDVAATYGMPDETFGTPGSIVPIYVKADTLIEFPVTVDRYGSRRFDKVEFDRRARSLAPGEVLVARQVVDIGPMASEAYQVDKEKKYSNYSDVYALGRGTPVESAVGKAKLKKETPSAVTPTEAQQTKEEGAAAPAEGTEVAGAPTPAAKTADQLQDEIRDLEQQRLALLTKNGRVPAVKSKARAKYDALGEQVNTLMGQWDETDRAERAAKKPTEAPPTEAPSTEVTQPFNEFEQQEYDLAQRFVALPNPQAVAFGEGILNRLQGPLRGKVKSDQKSVDFITQKLQAFEAPATTESKLKGTLADTFRTTSAREAALLRQYSNEIKNSAPASGVLNTVNDLIGQLFERIRAAGFSPDNAGRKSGAPQNVIDLNDLLTKLYAGGYNVVAQRLAQDRQYKNFSQDKLQKSIDSLQNDITLAQAKLQELATGKRTIEQVKQERDALLAEQQTLRTSTGKPPAVRSPARRKYDALTERINQLYNEELKLTPKEPTKVEEVTTKDLQDRVANIKATIAETEAELAAATEDGNIEALENKLDALEKDLKNAQLDLREKIEAEREGGLLDIVEILLGGDEFQSGKSKKRAYIDNVGGAYNSQGEYIGNVLVTNPSLRRAVAKYYKQLKAGKITAEQYAEEVNRIYEETKQDKQATDLVRGQYNFRERMLRALRLGELPRVGVELAEWFISQNPRLLNDLAISIQQAKTEGPFAGAAGVYLPLPRIVRLFVGSVKDTTIIHEILHHLERLMPEEAQSAIRKMWLTSLVDRLKRNIPAAERRYLALIHKHVMGGGDAQALKQAMEMVSKGQVPYQMYQYINPSEFWAVNASEIVKGRYGGTFSVIARIKQWLSELVEKAKELFALPSNAPLIRALDSLAKADGSYKSEHLLAKNLDSYQSIVSGANDAIELDLTPTVIGAAASSKYEPDPAEAAFIESNLENKTLIQVGDWLAKNGPNAAYRVIASAATRKLRQLQRAGVTFNFKITHLGDKVPPGFAYSGRGYTQTIYGGVGKGTTNVYINGSDVTGRSGVAFYVALHELIHAATMSTIRLGRYKKINNVDLQNTDLHKSVKALYDVYGAIINHINNRKKTLPFDQLTEIEQDAIKSVNNAFDDPYEIISWALTWPEMQKYLDSIPYKNTNRSLWGAFVVAIRKLLNLPESTDSALSEILQVADELFNADIKELKNVSSLKGESLALAGPPPTPPGQQPPVRPLNPPGTVVNQSPQFPKPSPPGVLPGTNVPLNQPPPTPPGGQPPIVAGKKRPRGPRGPISGKSPWRTAEDATKTLTGVLNDALKGRTPWGKAVGSLAPAIWNPINSKLRRAFLFSATLRQLADITRFKFPQLVTAINIVDKMTSFRLGKLGEAQIIAKDWLDAQNKKPAQSTLVGRIMLDATINGKDPDKGPTGIANLDAAWASLDPEFQVIYRRVRDYFNNNLQEMIREMKKRVLKLPKAERQAAIRKINEQFAPDKLVFPYFPLRRFGEYWFQVGKGNFKEFYEFESEVTRELSRAARIRELKSGNAQQKALAETVDFGAGISELFSKNLASTQILKEVQDLIDSIVPPTGATSTKSAQDVRKELQDSLNQLIYIMLPQQSMRKMFINRKAVQGASSDMLRVFTDVAVHSAYQMARFKYGEDFINNINKARDYINEFFKPDARAVYRDFVNELEARTKTVLSAEDKSFLAKAAGTAGTFVFFSMLSAPFTALLNTLGFAVFTGSKLGGKYGYTEASEVMLKNMGRYWQTAPGRMLKPAAKGLIFQMKFPSIVEGGKLSPLLQRAADRFIAEGQIDVSLTNDIFDLTERPSELYTTRYNILKKILGGLFHQSERANREVALMSAFELEYNRLLNSPKRDTRGVIERDANGNPVTYTPDEAFEGAIQEAKHIAGLTLGDFSRQMKSRLFANVPLSVLLKFKQYAFMATYNYMRALQLSLSPLFDKKELNDIRDRFIQEKIPQAEIDQRMEDIKNFRRDIAKQSGKELLGILGVTFLFGGLEAMPFFWIALPAMFLMLASDDDKEDEESNYLNWFRNWADERLGGMSLARGPISQLIGGSLSERVSLDPLSMFYRDGRYSPDVVEGLIQDVIANAGPVVGLAMNWAEAAKLFGEGQYSRAWEKILPALFAKPLQAYRYGTEGATTRSGEEQLAAEKFSEWMLVMQAVGLQPEELALKQKSAIQAKEKEQKILAKETGLLNRLWLERDNAKGFDTALDKALQFYEKYPDMLPEDGDFSEKLMTSFEVRAEQIAEAEAFGARIDKRLRERIAPMLEYGQPKPKPPEKMTLEEVRQKYPQYSDVPDKELSDALKAKGLLK